MNNKEIAYAFDELASLMELHGDDDFRIKSYKNAYLTIRKLDSPLSAMKDDEIKAIKGVGNAISGKIRELLDNGKMANLEKYRDKTPPGVQEMLELNGFGPKKVRQVWQENCTSMPPTTLLKLSVPKLPLHCLEPMYLPSVRSEGAARSYRIRKFWWDTTVS